jgi:hypothetical protein
MSIICHSGVATIDGVIVIATHDIGTGTGTIHHGTVTHGGGGVGAGTGTVDIVAGWYIQHQ